MNQITESTSTAMTESGPDPIMVILQFDTAEIEVMTAVLSKYVVVSRSQEGCRNIDFVASMTTPGRLVVVEKWDSLDAQQAHFDSPDMVEMARSCEGILTRPPTIDLYEGISMHDLA